MNFYCIDCQEQPQSVSIFGLCDDQNGTKAYTDVINQEQWIATVNNPNNIEITFTAIDKCVIKNDEERGRGRCDGMLTSDNHIYFIELKDQASNWMKHAIEQLESTIQFYMANHDISIYRHKKAFACNKRHRRFQEIDNELNLRFFRTYGVRIDAQADVIIV
ncbi:MAG: hypothetical protein LBU84_18990 [Prevotella sp.]|jgi:hypothetical protein|nr:hypothetical protein [Prevotella sp.]